MRTTDLGRVLSARLVEGGVRVGMALLALMAFLVVLQVIARNFLNVGLPWADELARFSGIGLVFLTVPALAGRGGMVSVTMLPDMARHGLRRWLILLADVATLAFCALLLWGFADFLPRAGKFLTPALRMPNWGYYGLALLGSLMLGAIAVFRVLETLRGRDPREPFLEPEPTK